MFKLLLLIYYPTSQRKNSNHVREGNYHSSDLGRRAEYSRKESKGEGHWFSHQRIEYHSRQGFQDSCDLSTPEHHLFRDRLTILHMWAVLLLKVEAKKSLGAWMMSASFTTFCMRDQTMTEIQGSKFLSCAYKHRAFPSLTRSIWNKIPSLCAFNRYPLKSE